MSHLLRGLCSGESSTQLNPHGSFCKAPAATEHLDQSTHKKLPGGWLPLPQAHQLPPDPQMRGHRESAVIAAAGSAAVVSPIPSGGVLLLISPCRRQIVHPNVRPRGLPPAASAAAAGAQAARVCSAARALLLRGSVLNEPERSGAPIFPHSRRPRQS